MMAYRKRAKLCLSINLLGKWLLLLIIGLYCQNALSNAIFYQPQSRDESFTTEQWDDLFQKVYQDGYREIVIQWTQYGSTNFVTNAGFLKEILHIAQAKKFKIWLGLYLPGDYYSVMENKKLASAEYFKSAISENIRRLSQLEIQSLINTESFAGWYLPMELTHNYLQQHTKRSREVILEALKDLKSSVKEKIAVSYFLSKDTTLRSAFFDTALLNTMGFNLLLQKGDGLKKHTVANQLIKRMGCDTGIISENFIQTSDNNTPFKARKSSTNKSLDKLKICQKRFTFSLRYLPYSSLQFSK